MVDVTVLECVLFSGHDHALEVVWDQVESRDSTPLRYLQTSVQIPGLHLQARMTLDKSLTFFASVSHLHKGNQDADLPGIPCPSP